jgi:hypothetical protein
MGINPHWDSTFKPQPIVKHRELQSVDIDALSDEELVETSPLPRPPHRDDLPPHAPYRRGP